MVIAIGSFSFNVISDIFDRNRFVFDRNGEGKRAVFYCCEAVRTRDKFGLNSEFYANSFFFLGESAERENLALAYGLAVYLNVFCEGGNAYTELHTRLFVRFYFISEGVAEGIFRFELDCDVSALVVYVCLCGNGNGNLKSLVRRHKR